jgi:phosphate transport system substrate-binding protein
MHTRKTFSLLSLVVLAALMVSACGGQPAQVQPTTAPQVSGTQPPAAQPTQPSAMEGLSGDIRIDGSSTVFPISEAVGEEFQIQHPKTRVTVGLSGTGGGFKKFCNKEIDISDASRPIKQEEADLCSAAGIEYVEFSVAYDGLSVLVNPQNDFVECLTVDELKKIWAPEAEGQVMTWQDVRAEWPDEPLKLFGPGTDSGTFDYFTEVINGKAKASRPDYTPSEDDNVLVQGIAGEKYALGYFGFAYYEENQDKLKLVAVDNGDGNCVVPSKETIEGGTYKPLSRPLFIYASKTSLARSEVAEFVRFYLENAPTLAADVGYVALPAADYEKGLKDLDAAIMQ